MTQINKQCLKNSKNNKKKFILNFIITTYITTINAELVFARFFAQFALAIIIVPIMGAMLNQRFKHQFFHVFARIVVFNTYDAKIAHVHVSSSKKTVTTSVFMQPVEIAHIPTFATAALDAIFITFAFDFLKYPLMKIMPSLQSCSLSLVLILFDFFLQCLFMLFVSVLSDHLVDLPGVLLPLFNSPTN